MDRHNDPAFFTDEEIASFAISEQVVRIYISSSSKSSVHVHPDLNELVSDQLDLKDATSASIVPMASALAKVREEETIRELENCPVSLPYFHDENRYRQIMMDSPDDDNSDNSDLVIEATEETPAFIESKKCNDGNDRDGMSASFFNQDTEQVVDSITNSEHNHDDISNEVHQEEVSKTWSECSSEKGNDGDTSDAEEGKLQTEAQQQSSNTPIKKSLFSDINAGIVSQREKIRDICNNRQKSSKKKQPVRRGNCFKEVRQKCGDESSDEEMQSHEKQAAANLAQRQEVDEKSESGASEGFLDTEDEQSDDLIEFETQTKLPITRKRKSNSLLATSEAIGSSITAKASTDKGGDSEWISRATKRRSKLKKSAKRVSLDNSSSNKPSVNKQNSTATATQHRNRGGRRSVGFGAAPKTVNKRKTQLSLLQMLKKK